MWKHKSWSPFELQQMMHLWNIVSLFIGQLKKCGWRDIKIDELWVGLLLTNIKLTEIGPC